MAVINVTEELVKLRVQEIFAKDSEHCTCERCYDDIVALACNSLPAKYIATPAGAVFEKLNYTRQQSAVDINSAIYKAMQIVWTKPHH